LYEQRLKNPAPQISLPNRGPKTNADEIANQLRQYRAEKKLFHPSKPRMMTLADLDRQDSSSEAKAPEPVYNSISSFSAPNNLRIRAFELVFAT
jgi:hypothetical protein